MTWDGEIRVRMSWWDDNISLFLYRRGNRYNAHEMLVNDEPSSRKLPQKLMKAATWELEGSGPDIEKAGSTHQLQEGNNTGAGKGSQLKWCQSAVGEHQRLGAVSLK